MEKLNKSMIISLLCVSSFCLAQDKVNTNLLDNIYIDLSAGYGLISEKTARTGNILTAIDVGYKLNDNFSAEFGIYSFPEISKFSFVGGDNYIANIAVKETFKNVSIKFGIGDYYKDNKNEVTITVAPGIDLQINEKVKFTISELIAVPYKNSNQWAFGAIAGLNITL